MNLNLTSTIQMPSHQLRRQVIGLCKMVGKPLLKLSTKDYVDNGLGHLVEQFLRRTDRTRHHLIEYGKTIAVFEQKAEFLNKLGFLVFGVCRILSE